LSGAFDSPGAWWRQGATGIEAGLRFYAADTDAEIEQAYDAIEVPAKSRRPHSINADELATVVQFKLWKGIRRYAAGQVLAAPPPDEVTAIAFEQARNDEVHDALKTLDGLRQVGIPTASAVLAAVYPERFAVIDRYIMAEVAHVLASTVRDDRTPDEALGLLGDSLGEWATTQGSAAGTARAYVPFVKGLQMKATEVSRPSGITCRPRDIEKAMYGHFLSRTGRRNR